MDASTVRVVCAVLAVLFIGIIVLRRKKTLNKGEFISGGRERGLRDAPCGND